MSTLETNSTPQTNPFRNGTCAPRGGGQVLFLKELSGLFTSLPSVAKTYSARVGSFKGLFGKLLVFMIVCQIYWLRTVCSLPHFVFAHLIFECPPQFVSSLAVVLVPTLS